MSATLCTLWQQNADRFGLDDAERALLADYVEHATFTVADTTESVIAAALHGRYRRLVSDRERDIFCLAEAIPSADRVDYDAEHGTVTVAVTTAAAKHRMTIPGAPRPDAKHRKANAAYLEAQRALADWGPRLERSARRVQTLEMRVPTLAD